MKKVSVIKVESGKMLMYGDNSYQGIRYQIKLKSPVNGELLQKAVDYAAGCHPWICYGMEERDGEFYYNTVPDRTLTVVEITDGKLPPLGGKEPDP